MAAPVVAAVARGATAAGPSAAAAGGAARGAAAAAPRAAGGSARAAGPLAQPAGGVKPDGPGVHEPPWDRVPPRARPVGPPEGLSSVPAFDRPQAVIVTGPRPLPVTIVGGMPGGAPAPKEKEAAGRPLVGRVTDGFRLAGEMASGAGRTASAVAQGSATAAFSGAVSVATAGLSRLGPYGAAAAAGLQAVSAGVTAFRDAVASFVARAKELGGYDGRIAGANAMAEVRRINSDMREANRLGDQLSKLVNAQSKSEAMWDEILLTIKGPIIEALTGGLDIANQALAALVTLANKMTFGQIEWLDRLAQQMGKIIKGEPGDDLDKRIREFTDAPLGGFVAPAPAGGASGAMPSVGMPLVH